MADPIERFRLTVDAQVFAKDEAVVLKIHAASADRHKPAHIERVLRVARGADLPLSLIGMHTLAALRELVAGKPVPYMLQGYAASGSNLSGFTS